MDDLDQEHDGTPEKAWPPWARTYLDSIAAIPNESRAAEQAGVRRNTVWRLKQRDEAFALAAAEARDSALDLLEQQIYARATAGTPERKTVTKTLPDGSVEVTVTETLHVSDTLAMFYLKRWRPEYREATKVELGGSTGAPIKIKVDRERSPERLEELLTSAADAGLLEGLGLRVVADVVED